MTQFQLTDLIVVLFLSLVVGYLVVSFLVPERIWKNLSRGSRFPLFNRRHFGRAGKPERARPSRFRVEDPQTTRTPVTETAPDALPTEREYAEILGLSGRVTLSEIKAAYRSEIAKYHPDKVAHLAAEFREMAQVRTRRIRAAYEFFQGKYGLR